MYQSKIFRLAIFVGMDFDGASSFSGKKTGVQARQKHAPHAVFVHSHCHLLQLACVQAANCMSGIKHVYITLITLWEYFLYFPKRAESLKEIGGDYTIFPETFIFFCTCHNFFPLSSVQIIIIPACCLLCVL